MENPCGSLPKPRKLWIDSTPFTPEGLRCDDNQDSPVHRVKLVHFAKKPIIDFGTVKTGHTRTKPLIVENPNPYDVDAVVEKFPWKKNFSIDQESLIVAAEDFCTLEITWSPKETGNYRELVMIKFESSFRVHALLIGKVENPKKKVRRGHEGRARLSTRRKINAATAIKENVDPVCRSSKTSEKMFPDQSTGSPITIQLHTSLLKVLKDNSRDSCGSTTAPVSPSGFNVPKIETEQVPNATVNCAPPVAKTEQQNFSDFSQQSFEDQGVTGRPTFVLTETSMNKPSSLSCSKEESYLTEGQNDSLETAVPVAKTQPKTCHSSESNRVHETMQDRLSSTHSHDHTINFATLPVPDISAIVIMSPQKEGSTRKRKSDDERSPFANDPVVSKRRSVDNFTRSKRKSVQRRSRGLPQRPTVPKIESPKTSGVRRRIVSKCGPSIQEKKLKRKVKMPQNRLVLKPTATKKVPVASVPLPFCSRNIYYDEKWMEKQEHAYTCWLNYILTPDEFKPNLESNPPFSKNRRSQLHSSVFNKVSDTSTLNMRALSKEDASMRAYQIKKRLTRLRYEACKLFESQAVIQVLRNIEELVSCGHIRVRDDRQVWADLGHQSQIMDLLMSFNPLWLRVGLEATFGKGLPLQQGIDDIKGIMAFITRNLLSSDDVKMQFAHPTVPNLFKPGYEDKISKHILKKFLILIYYLDHAKQKRLIDHDPCLFKKESNFRNCNDMLVLFSRDLLQGEGDIVKHLSFVGYKVTHTQTYIDEFDFGIGNLAIDLRDGVRLVRVLELLFHDENLTSKLRVPAGTLSMKKHNVNIALKVLADHNVDTTDSNGKKVEADHIVKGSREMTLALLWNIAAHFQLHVAVNLELLQGEIEFLKKNLRLKHMLENTLHLYEEEISSGSFNEEKSNSAKDVSSMLLEWCRLVCAFKSIVVYNFSASFSDGRVLAFLISYYQSNLIHPSQISMTTTLSVREPCPSLDDSLNFGDALEENSQTMPSSKELLRNEKTNLKLVQNAAYQLGGIPNLLCIDDFSNTIPDNKVVRLLVSFLCIRLLDIRIEDRAARTIQVAWRAYLSQKQAREERLAEQERKLRYEKAALLIQFYFRKYLQKRQLAQRVKACILIQKRWRASKLMRSERNKFKNSRKAAIVIQCFFRRHLAQKILQQRRNEQRILQKKKQIASVIIQSHVRMYLARKLCAKKKLELRSAVLIQRKWRATHKMLSERRMFVAKRRSVIVLQSFARMIIMRTWYKNRLRKEKAAILIQQRWRGLLEMRIKRNKFLQQRSACVVIQCFVRMIFAKILCKNKRRLQAALKIQNRWRATMKMRHRRREFIEQRKAAIVLQSFVRMVLAKNISAERKRRLQATQMIQQKWRATLDMRRERDNFVVCRNAIVKLQSFARMILAKKLCKETARRLKATQIIQQKWRATLKMNTERKKFTDQRKAAVKLQCYFRMILAKKLYKEKKTWVKAAMIIQRRWKATIQMRQERKRFMNIQIAIVKLQSYFRMILARKLYKEEKTRVKAAQLIQERWRASIKMRQERKLYVDKIKNVIILQSFIRMILARKLYLEIKLREKAAQTIQKRWRATMKMRIERRNFVNLRRTAIVLQSFTRMVLAKNISAEKKRKLQAAQLIQQKWKATLDMRRERHSFTQYRYAIVKLQSFARMIFAKKLCKETARRVKAIKTIQRRWKATVVMQNERKKFFDQRKAAVKIQSFIRMILAKKQYIKERLRAEAALKIQQRWKATLEMRHEKQRFITIQKATVQLQSYFRMIYAKKLYLEEKTRMKAAITLQQRWKATMKMREARKQFVVQRKAAVKLQSYFRMILARKMFMQQRRMKAAQLIQQRWRATLKMRERRRDFIALRKAAIVLQSFARMVLAKNVCAEKKRRLKAARLIQQKWKATLIMRIERENFMVLCQAVLKLQSYTRMILAKKLRHEKKRKTKAAKILQQRWKASLMMRNERKDFLKKYQAIVVLQSFTRMVLARNIFLRRKEQARSAEIIQRYWRATLNMRKQRQKFLEQRSACVLLQSYVRMLIVKRSYKGIQRQVLAAVLIQERWRDFIKMKRQRKDFLRRRLSAMKIQRAFRSFKMRQCLRTLLGKHSMKRLSSALFIQRKWRATVLMREQRTKYLEILDNQKTLHAVMTIQRVFRGYCVRKNACHNHEITEARANCQKANLISVQNPERKIGFRMKLALDVLLDIRRYSEIYDSLQTLDNLSRLLPACCERISNAGGSEVLCALIDSSNRSYAATFVHKLSLQILLNLVRNTTTRAATLSVLRGQGRRNSTPPIELLVHELSKFRDKSGRDPSHAPIFCSACNLLLEFCAADNNVQILKANARLTNMIHYVCRETKARFKAKEQSMETARLKKQRESVSYLAQSFDEIERDRSFNHSFQRTAVQDTPVSHLSKSRRSLVPQRPLNIGVRIPRSKKSTKAQSPKFANTKFKPAASSTAKPAVHLEPSKNGLPSDLEGDRIIRLNCVRTDDSTNILACIIELSNLLK